MDARTWIICFCFFCAGMPAGILLNTFVAKKTLTQLDFYNDYALRSLFFGVWHQIGIDQAFIFLVKDKEFRSTCWSIDNPHYWQKIEAFERSLMTAMRNGVVENPFAGGDDTMIITDKIDENTKH